MYERIPAKDHISLRRQEPTKGMEKLHNHSSHSLEPVVPFDTKGMLCTWHVYSKYEYQTTICLKNDDCAQQGSSAFQPRVARRYYSLVNLKRFCSTTTAPKPLSGEPQVRALLLGF